MTREPRYETIRRFVRRHNRRRHAYFGRQARWQQARTAKKKKEPSVFEKLVDHENLLRVYYQMKDTAGQAAGPDRVTYGMLGRREVAAIMRGLSSDLRAGTFRPSRARHVKIPKADGGFRTLSVRSICFRVVAAALYKALTPLWELIFLHTSTGFRPDRGVWSMLLEMERIITTQDRWVIGHCDVRKAFDNVNINQVMEDHRRHITDPQLLGLIETVLRGHEDQKRSVGIDQGSAYSPTTLNESLHHHLDTPFSADAANPPQLRYADNNVYLCRSVPEGRQAIQQTRHHLETVGMSVKPESVQIADLRHGQATRILGFIVSQREGNVQFGIPKKAWKGLEENLKDAHRTANPTETANSVVSGWLAAYGPALESESAGLIIDRVLRIAADAGCREISREQVRRYIQGAVDRWQAFIANHQRKADQQHPLPTDAAPPAAADRPGRPAMPEAEVATGTVPATSAFLFH